MADIILEGLTIPVSNELKNNEELWEKGKVFYKQVYLLILLTRGLLASDNNTDMLDYIIMEADFGLEHSFFNQKTRLENSDRLYTGEEIHDYILENSRLDSALFFKLIGCFCFGNRLYTGIEKATEQEIINGIEILMKDGEISNFIKSNFFFLYSYITSQYQPSPETL